MIEGHVFFARAASSFGRREPQPALTVTISRGGEQKSMIQPIEGDGSSDPIDRLPALCIFAVNSSVRAPGVGWGGGRTAVRIVLVRVGTRSAQRL